MTTERKRQMGKGLTIGRYFTGSGKGALPPISTVDRPGTVVGADGTAVAHVMCAAPADWSQLALNTVVTRYLPLPATKQTKVSIPALVDKVARHIADRGREAGVFTTTRDANNFKAELVHACLARYGWFGARIWKNASVEATGSVQSAGRSLTSRVRKSSPNVSSCPPAPVPQAIHAPDEVMRDQRQLQLIAGQVHNERAAIIYFDDTIAAWHTCPTGSPLDSRTGAAGYFPVDNRACCNIATINVNQCLNKNGHFDIEALRHTVMLFSIALDILVDHPDCADDTLVRNIQAYRPIGLNYAGLSPVLMRLGLPYDSDEARTCAAALTSFITATVCSTSQQLAGATSPFSEYEANKASVLAVIRRHAAAAAGIVAPTPAKTLHAAARREWERIIRTAEATGFRNAQFTQLTAPSLAGFILDSDTSDISPMFSGVKYSLMADRKIEKHVNRCVDEALKSLGYAAAARRAICAHTLEENTVEGASGLKTEHLPVFDCAFPARRGLRALSVQANLKMIAAVQPSLSGCVARGIVLPETESVDTIAALIKDAWSLGLRILSIYRSSSVV